MASFRLEENAEWCNEVSTETPQGFCLWKTFDMKNKNPTRFFVFFGSKVAARLPCLLNPVQNALNADF